MSLLSIFKRRPRENGNGNRFLRRAVMRMRGGFDGGIPSSGVYGDSNFLRDGFPSMGDRALSSAYEDHSWTYASVRAVAKRIASVPWRVVTGPEDKPDPVLDHPMAAFFKQPSLQFTRSQVWLATVSFLFSPGACMWILLGKTSLVGRNEWPVEAIPLNGAWFIPLDEGGVQLLDPMKRPVQWKLQTVNGAITLETYQVVRFAEWSPKGPLYQQAILKAAQLAIEGDFQAAVWNLAFFLNSCDPGGWVELQQLLSDEQFKQLRKHWNDQHRGAAKRGETAFLEGGSKFVPNPRSQKDMEFSTLRAMSRDEVIAVTGATKASLGVTEDLSYANHEGQERILAEQTILPMLEDFREVINRDVFRGRDGVRADFDRKSIRALNSDFGMRVDTAQKLTAMGWTPNQVNVALNLDLPPAPNGDQPLTVTSGFDVFGTEPSPEEASASPTDELASLLGQKTARAWGPRAARKLALFYRDATVRRPAEKRVERAIAAWYRTVAADTLAAFTSATRAVLTEKQSDLVKELRAKWDKLISEKMGDPLMDALRSSAKQASQELGVLVDMGNPRLLELHANRLAEMVRVSHRLQEKIRDRLISLAANENATIDWQREQLKGFFEGNTGRALRVARTETGIMQEGTRYETFKEAGVETHEWVSSNDFSVRDSHARVDAEIVGIGEKFSNGLRHPMEIGGPPEEVINCNCSAVPII